MINKQNPKAFTLVEMLIVIVIIGILAAALIPRVINAQARARDTARTVDLRNVASAMDLYYTDNGGYPVANYTAATDTRQVAMRDLLIPTAYANTP